MRLNAEILTYNSYKFHTFTHLIYMNVWLERFCRCIYQFQEIYLSVHYTNSAHSGGSAVGCSVVSLASFSVVFWLHPEEERIFSAVCNFSERSEKQIRVSSFICSIFYIKLWFIFLIYLIHLKNWGVENIVSFKLCSNNIFILQNPVIIISSCS